MGTSFYGGMDGRPFIIKNYFSTVSEMITTFEQGHNYKAVNYGEYVIINTVNKNNPENGRIFRRAADLGTTQNIETWDLIAEKNIFEMTLKKFNGAVYVGQIVGPSGNAPHFISLPTHLPQLDEEGKYKYDNNNNLLYEEKLSDYEEILQRYTAYDTRVGKGVFSIENTHLVPGKEGEDFNDNIAWQYCSVRDENGQETSAYIGFTFPYMIVEWDAKSESPYYNRNDVKYDENGEIIPESLTNDFDNINLVDREDDTLHPFYQKWKINVPKGIHGQNIENLALEEKTGLITYDIHNFDIKADGTVEKKTLNENYPLTWIKEIDINQDGTVSVKSNNDTQLLSNEQEKLKWVESVELKENGTFLRHFNNGENSTEQDSKLIWPVNIHINPENGKVITTYNNGEKNDSQSPKMNWVKRAELSKNKQLQIDFINTDSISVNLKTPNRIDLTPTGDFLVYYNSDPGTAVYLGNIGELGPISACAAAIERDVPKELKVGGLWFVIQEESEEEIE